MIRNRITVRSNRLNAKKKELAPIISKFLFHDEDNSVPDKKDYVKLKIEIRDALKETSFRRVLTEILLDLQKDVSGETRKKLNELFVQLDLHHDAYKKLNDWRWHIVSQGILELTQMQVVDSFNFITKFINDRRGIIRKQAEVATVSLKPEGISYFLDTTQFNISEWQQLKLMEVLRDMEHFRPPAFKTWLVSGNRDVVLFALRLIRHYNQNEAGASIIELVKHKNERVKMEAIQCIKEFCLINALDVLKAVFAKAGPTVQIEILDTLATLGNEEDLEFLTKVEQSSSTFLVKNKAQMAINEIMPETFIPSKDILTKKELDTSVIAQDQFDDEYLAEEINKIAAAGEEGPIESAKELAPSEPEIEVEDIEVFEVDPKSIPIFDTVEVESEAPSQEEEIVETTFEISPIDDELDASINNQIGLVDNSDVELGFSPQEDLPEADHYFEMNPEEKDSFIEILEDSATDKEIPLLEELMQKEEDSETRYRFFKKLKSIKNQEEEGIDNSETQLEDEKAIRSVFHDLLEYASDIDSKLILLREISEVGDEKELPLLELLKRDNNPQLKAQVEKTKNELLQRLGDSQNSELQNNNADLEDRNQDTSEISIDKIVSSNRERLPLEFCFLEDYGISTNKESGPEIGFELTEEFYQEQERRIALDK